VTLGRLVLAWIPVAAWFVVAALGTPGLMGWRSKPADQAGAWPAAPRGFWKWPIAEAGLLTLFASLWFDSLGSGGWWLLFALVGALATVPKWLPGPERALPNRVLLVGACADLARYEIAGAILAWRLG
jgi:hypothetical protein